jgi:hypothetical protein
MTWRAVARCLRQASVTWRSAAETSQGPKQNFQQKVWPSMGPPKRVKGRLVVNASIR